MSRNAGAARSIASVWRVLVESARAQILVVRTNPTVPILTIVQPAVFLTLLVARGDALSPAQATDTVVAVILTSMWGSTLWATGGILRFEVADGTLAKTMVATVDARLVTIGKCLGVVALTLGLLLCTAATMVAVLDVPIHLRNGGLIIVGLLSVAISGVTLGFALSGLFVLTRHAVHLTAALTYPVFIFGGLIVPTSLLPGPFRWPSHLINLYWANRFVAAAVQGSFDAKSLADLLLLSGAYLWTGWWLFARMVDRSRSEGTLDLV